MNDTNQGAIRCSDPSNQVANGWKWTVAIVSFAVVLRIIAALVWQYQCEQAGQTLRFGDSHSYWTIARNVVVNGQYQYGSPESKIFRAPVYPLFLTLFTYAESLSGGQPARAVYVLGARIAGCLMGGLAVWMLMRWTYEVSGAVAARIAGLFAACYCGAVGMSIFVLSEAVATPLFVASVWFLWRSVRLEQESDYGKSRSTRTTAASATTLALACLARPSWGLWPVFAISLILVASKARIQHRRRKGWQQAGIFFLVLCLVMSPWWVRNYVITGKFVPSTLQVGASLYDGWHEGASGSSDENMGFSMEAMDRIVQEEELLANQGGDQKPPESTLEWRIDRRLRQEAMDWASENPSDALSLGLVKFWRTWSPAPKAQELSNPWIRWWEAGSYLAILCMSGVGIYRLRLDRRGWIAASSFALPSVYLAVLHMVFIGSVRYRQPGVLILCGLAAIGLESLIRSRKQVGYKTEACQSKDAIGIASQPDRKTTGGTS